MDFDFINYKEEPQSLTKDKVIDFWTENGALNRREEGEERIKDVVFVALDENNSIAAVSSVFTLHEEELGIDCFVNRVFVKEESRRNHLSLELTQRIFHYLQEEFDAGRAGTCVASVAAIQNPELIEFFSQGRIDSVGSQSILYGFTEEGYPKRIRYFVGAKIA